MNAVRITLLVALAAMAVFPGCGSSDEQMAIDRARANARSKGLVAEDDNSRCAASGEAREVTEYDTSGDQVPDVRKVFLKKGEPPFTRLIMICREADLNGDGSKDVVRHYTDEGRPLREESDRNFDGQMDEIAFFENGSVVRVEADTTGSGQIDTKVYYEKGQPVRAERDLAGRSSVKEWKPDRWEYFERGRMVRMGTDVDGDGKVDRWDRNDDLREQLEKQGGGGDDAVGDANEEAAADT